MLIANHRATGGVTGQAVPRRYGTPSRGAGMRNQHQFSSTAILAIMDERIELLRRAYETFNAGDVDFSLFHPDLEIVQTSSLVGTAGTFRGHDGLRRSTEELLQGFEEVRFEPEDQMELDDGRMLVRCRFVGRGTRSGIELDSDVWHI